MKTVIHGCRVISPGLDLPEASVAFENGLFQEISSEKLAGDMQLHADWLCLVPGFIDIHSHGAGGADVTDGKPASLARIADCKLAEGVTTWLPTTLTLPVPELTEILQVVEAYRPDAPLSIPGIHLEGPFINPKAVGAQNPAYVQAPNVAVLEKLANITPMKILSLASEMPRGVEMVRWATARGIICSLAHTAATYADFLAAKAAGLRHLTHFCNQMTPLHHREIGIVGAGLMDAEIMLELICDGVHLAPDMLRLVFATQAVERLMLITDSMAASHLGDGNFVLGGMEVTVKDNQARLASGALAGSTLVYPKGLEQVHECTGLPLVKLIPATSWNQAQSLGLLDRGQILPGMRADFALLRPDFSVHSTWVAGECVWES